MPGGGGSVPMFILSESSGTRTPLLKVEAFNMSVYLDVSGDEKKQKIVDERLAAIQELIRETIHEFISMNMALTGLKFQSTRMPVVKFHRGTQLLVVIGQESFVAIAAKVLEALPGVTRSTYSDEKEPADTKHRQDLSAPQIRR